MLAWGKIVPVGGREALEPGLKFSKWPYPIGDFVLFRDKHRRADVDSTFWPNIPEGQTFDRAVERASTATFLSPGKDGYLLTRDVDIAHLKLSVEYELLDPVAFVHSLENENPDPAKLDADKLVRLSNIGQSPTVVAFLLAIALLGSVLLLMSIRAARREK